jgi:hypothetical protein
LTHASSYPISPTSVARSSMRIQRSMSFQASPSVCPRTTRSTTSVRPSPFPPAPPFPRFRTTTMTRLFPPSLSANMLVVANLVLNYSPFLSPTTRTAPPTVELRRLLGIAAHDMLEQFLRKWRRVRGDSSTSAVRTVRCLTSFPSFPPLLGVGLRASLAFTRR